MTLAADIASSAGGYGRTLRPAFLGHGAHPDPGGPHNNLRQKYGFDRPRLIGQLNHSLHQGSLTLI
jgi:hypothetical protein